MVQIIIYPVYKTMPFSHSSLGLYLQIWDIFVFITGHIKFIKSPPTLWWWRLIVFAESARRRHLFLLSLENPYSDYFQIFAVCILALGNLPSDFFSAFVSFFNKIQDGRQNPMAHART